MTRHDLTVIPCGGAKRTQACPARQLYIGGYFRQALATAEMFPAPIMILSAKHGLLDLDEIVEPYDVIMGGPGSITVRALYEQARALDLLDASVTILAGGNYVKAAKAVWPHARTPLAGRGSFLGALKELRRVS